MLILVPRAFLCNGRSRTCLMEHVEWTLCLDADLELLAMLSSKDTNAKLRGLAGELQQQEGRRTWSLHRTWT
jgi:hypothetical protein